MKRPHGKGFVVVHIGPADLMDEDYSMYRRFGPLLNSSGRVVLVEPHPGQRRRLMDRIGEVHHSGTVSLLPAAVCPSPGDGATFFRISDAFFKEFRDYAFYMRYWASLSKGHLIRETQFFNSNQKVWLFKALGIFPTNFPETSLEWEPYIEEAPVRCFTPAGLLAHAGVAPHDVDVLLLDAEGYDVELMPLFLALDGFSPATIMFEWHLHANNVTKIEALVRLVRALHTRGYDIHRHNHDVVAVTGFHET
mmetsp:Transcript_144924/g.449902  ORF Transcript_144924/g.449902 Transcript_144924/m.449902 type:complete len:250 (-) Transcript_144924:51-800(-)